MKGTGDYMTNIEKTIEKLKSLMALIPGMGYIDYELEAQNEEVYIEKTFNDTYYVYYCKIERGEYYNTIEKVAEALCDYNTTVHNIVDEEERYRNEEIPKLNAYYKKHIEGKTRDEIEPSAFDFYSDWHKDVYGYRPRFV